MAEVGDKCNFWAQEIGTQNGVLKFGALSPTGDVTSSISLTAFDSRHFIAMDEDGKRKNWTTMNAPGAFQINAGEDLLQISENSTGGRENKVEQNCIFMNAENGDIVIKARNGKIRFEGLDIEMVATGNSPEGQFWVKANENIKMDSKNITIDGTLSVNLVSSGVIHMRSSLLQMTSGFVNGITAATLKSVIPKSLKSLTKLLK